MQLVLVFVAGRGRFELRMVRLVQLWLRVQRQSGRRRPLCSLRAFGTVTLLRSLRFAGHKETHSCHPREKPALTKAGAGTVLWTKGALGSITYSGIQNGTFNCCNAASKGPRLRGDDKAFA